MFENMQKAQLNHITKSIEHPSHKDKKNFNRYFKNFGYKLRKERQHTYLYNGLEIYVTVYPGKHPSFDLTTDYFPHTFSSDPKDIRYDKRLTWANLQGCWNDNQKMYNFVTQNLINYRKEVD